MFVKGLPRLKPERTKSLIPMVTNYLREFIITFPKYTLFQQSSDLFQSFYSFLAEDGMCSADVNKCNQETLRYR